tara:strand:+ start:50 stop:436 length:387 start_codon:yes stop_codon:yes gene_type:complete
MLLEEEILFQIFTFLNIGDINSFKKVNKKISSLKIFDSDFLWENIILNNPNCIIRKLNQQKEIKYKNYTLKCNKLSTKSMYKEIKRIINNDDIFDRKDKKNKIPKIPKISHYNNIFNDNINFYEIARY